MVARFRSTGEKRKPHSTAEGRSSEAQRAYIRKFGPQKPRRKRIWPKEKAKGGRIGKQLGGGFARPLGGPGVAGVAGAAGSLGARRFGKGGSSKKKK